MNQEIIIRNSKWQNGAGVVIAAVMTADIVYTLLAEKLAVYEYLTEGLFLLFFIWLFAYCLKLMRDQAPKIILSEKGVWIRQALQSGSRTAVEQRFAWNEIQKAELAPFTLSVGRQLRLHTRQAECWQTDLVGIPLGGSGRLCRQLEALRQAAPEQRAELIARFQAA